MKTYLLDTNILLRYLCNDHKTHSPAAKKLIAEATAGKVSLKVPFTAITETIYTLHSLYKLNREDIGRELLKVLNAEGITLTCPDWVLEAIDDFRSKNIKFGDACLAAEARANKLVIASYDEGIDKLGGVTRFAPK